MVRCAVVGTSWISQSFCEAADATGLVTIRAVYSRTLQRAQHFSAPLGDVKLFTDLELLAKDPEIDAVYIASPNSLHAQQAMMFMNCGKHVLLEKPAASNDKEVEALIVCAKANRVILLEAMKSRYVPNLVLLKQAIESIGPVHRASLNFCQLSSRYRSYLQGDNPNTFNPVFSNGSLMDIGVYPLSMAYELFGQPQSINASGKLLSSGVDGHGTVLLSYPQSEVVVTHSKVSQSAVPSEIQGERGSVLIGSISRLHTLSIASGSEAPQAIDSHQDDNEMIYEIKAFVELIGNGQYEHEGLEKMRVVSQWLIQARQQVGIIYPADELR